MLRPGFMLPPLMFSEEEIEALVLGSRWVAERGDDALGAAARNALAKIAAVLPDDLRDDARRLDAAGRPGRAIAAGDVDLGPVRQAIRTERKLAHRLSRRRRRRSTAHHLAVRARLLRPGARGRRRGARCARTSAISAPTASPRSSRPTSAIRAAARRC